jgi:Mg-chelatase subunit ChlD
MTDWNLTFTNPTLWWLLLAIPLFLVAGRAVYRRTGPAWLDAMRGVVLVLLVVTLAGPVIVQGARNATTIFVIDRSSSIEQSSADAANAWVSSALAEAGVDQEAAVVTFGAQPDLAEPPTAASSLGDAWQQGDPMGDATDLASALTLARSLPVGDNRHIVVLSDGEETTGAALEQVDQAQADGVVIDVVPLPGIDPGDLRVERLDGPTSTWQGEPVSLVAHVTAGGGGTASLDVLVDGVAIQTLDLDLQPGTTMVPIALPAAEPGFHAVDVVVSGSSELDRVAGNNGAWLGFVVRDQPQVLVVAPVGADSSRLEAALSAAGAQAQAVTPDQVPFRTSDLAGFDAIFLNNVPAWDLSDGQQSTIVNHTRDGNGLVVIGGSAAYGPGSYAGTPLEAAMPVTVKVVDGQRRPSVAVLIIMDQSGSMSYDPREGSTSKLNLAKTGVVTAASALGTGDQLGVIAFNDEPVWALPMTTLTGAGDIGAVEDALAPISAEGGTELYPALQVGYDQLRNVDADVRHIILLSDGKSRSGTRDTYGRLVSDLGNDNITLSTVALGTDADLELLEFLATTGNGRYHLANTPEEIPQITFEEAQNAGSQSVLRGAFTPVQSQASPILNDIDVTSMPPIQGYNFAEGRTGAQVDLVSDRGDPLLAKWQLGLGRVVSWTADDGSDYAVEWAAWEQFDQFWGATLRWTLPDPDNQAVSVAMAHDGETAQLTLESRSITGEAIDLDDERVDVTGPDGVTTTVAVSAVAPGTYEGTVPSSLDGGYRVDLPELGLTLATSLPPSPEWQPSGQGPQLLGLLAERTGGTVHSLDVPADASLFAAPGNGANAPGVATPLWMYPLIAALILFVAEIALRQSRMWAQDSLADRPGT